MPAFLLNLQELSRIAVENSWIMATLLVKAIFVRILACWYFELGNQMEDFVRENGIIDQTKCQGFYMDRIKDYILDPANP